MKGMIYLFAGLLLLLYGCQKDCHPEMVRQDLPPIKAFQVMGRSHTSFTFVQDSAYFVQYMIPEENLPFVEMGPGQWFFDFVYAGKSFRASTVYPYMPCDAPMSVEIHAPRFTYLALGPGPNAYTPDFLLHELKFHPLVQDSLIVSSNDQTPYSLDITANTIRLYGEYADQQAFSGQCVHLYIYCSRACKKINAIDLLTEDITLDLPGIPPLGTITLDIDAENSITVNGGYYDPSDTILVVNYKGNPVIQNNVQEGIVVFNDVN